MRKPFVLLLIILAVATGLLVGYLKGYKPRSVPIGPHISVCFLDASLGNAIVVTTPERRTTVIDPGSIQYAQYLVDYLKSSNVKTLDLIITDPSAEHAGAAGAIINSFKVRRMMFGEKEPTTRLWRAALLDGKTKHIQLLTLTKDSSVELSSTCRVGVLSPPKKLLPKVDRSSANNSLVLRLVYGDTAFLLTSEMKSEAEAFLINSGCSLESDVLAVARHGRYGSTSLEFLSRVRPQCCVIAAGRGAERPSPSVLDRIHENNSGANLYRTDKDGTIDITSDGKTITVSTRPCM